MRQKTKLVTIVGARPQIIKAAALSRAIAHHYSEQIEEVIVHTGQHYDENMSQVFFNEMGVPQPDYNLGIGSASHAVQTARMITGIEKILLNEKPDYLVVYGDTNSTLAGAMAASKLHIPVVHIEAGLRSFNKNMPEEINRILCDHVSTLLFSPTQTGFRNLVKEGFYDQNQMPFTADAPGIFHCGDIMYDNSLFFRKKAAEKSTILKDLGVENGKFILATIHRDNNTDQAKRLQNIFAALQTISTNQGISIVLPLHPRTEKMMEINLEKEQFDEIQNNPRIRLIPPVSFFDMIQLESACELVITDSGGVQKEAYFFNKPSTILRSETEWTEIVDEGCALLVDADEKKITDAFSELQKNKNNLVFPPIFGDGMAAEFVCQVMIENYNLAST